MQRINCNILSIYIRILIAGLSRGYAGIIGGPRQLLRLCMYAYHMNVFFLQLMFMRTTMIYHPHQHIHYDHHNHYHSHHYHNYHNDISQACTSPVVSSSYSPQQRIHSRSNTDTLRGCRQLCPSMMMITLMMIIIIMIIIITHYHDNTKLYTCNNCIFLLFIIMVYTM